MVVFTNGCFDILHAGHVRLLEFARRQGDELVVAVNSDASVRRLKGPWRPIMPFADRMTLLAALRCVDHLQGFDESRPLHLIRRWSPCVYVKGPACRGPETPEMELVRELGGRVVIPDWPVDYSTSCIVDMIRRRYRHED